MNSLKINNISKSYKLLDVVKDISMEIKSVVLRSSGGVLQHFHGVVNNEEDKAAKDFGTTNYSAQELKFFSFLIGHLLEVRQIITQDANDLKKQLIQEGKCESI